MPTEVFAASRERPPGTTACHKPRAGAGLAADYFDSVGGVVAGLGGAWGD